MKFTAKGACNFVADQLTITQFGPTNAAPRASNISPGDDSSGTAELIKAIEGHGGVETLRTWGATRLALRSGQPVPTQYAGSIRMSAVLVLASLSLFLCRADAQNTITPGATTVMRGTTNLGTQPDYQACLTFLGTQGAGTSYQCRVNVNVNAPPPATTPSVTLVAAPGNVQPGQTATLNWAGANVSTCAAGGSWTGAKTVSGSQVTAALTATSTFSLSCTGSTGTANASTTVTVASAGPQTGLDFPSNSSPYVDNRMRFTGSALLPMQPATYIWNLMPRQQTGYYTTFFHGPSDGSFSGNGSYYGAHPYPNSGPGDTAHKWEVSTWGFDYTTDANGNSTTVQYGQWYTQALVVANNVLTFYWSLPDTNRRIVVNAPGPLSPSSSQALTFGDAPWNLYSERLNGVLRGIRLYSASLSAADVLSEANSPLSTSAGTAAIWYLNMNPTPNDISDRSGRGHHPMWSSNARPGLWQQ